MLIQGIKAYENISIICVADGRGKILWVHSTHIHTCAHTSICNNIHNNKYLLVRQVKRREAILFLGECREGATTEKDLFLGPIRFVNRWELQDTQPSHSGGVGRCNLRGVNITRGGCN